MADPEFTEKLNSDVRPEQVRPIETKHGRFITVVGAEQSGDHPEEMRRDVESLVDEFRRLTGPKQTE